MLVALAGCGSGRKDMEREAARATKKLDREAATREDRPRVELGLLQRTGGNALGERRRDHGAAE